MATTSTPGGGTINVDYSGGIGSISAQESANRTSGQKEEEKQTNDRPNIIPGYVNQPAPSFLDYDPITRAPYTMQNIKKFAKNWGQFNRSQILKNYQLADELALDQLDTELKGLQNYVPAASALKRSETAADNVFNQAQRTAQVNQALPEVYAQLQAQAARAESFASGRMPSDIEDRALELGIRSQAADYASAGGFGATSSVARKASDLLSAQQRIALSQYGDQLLTNNIGTKANLYLAPTEYSNAGTQVNVMPSISGSQLASSNLANINQLTTISPTTALSAKINEKQFVAGLEQQTRQFNATNQLATDQYNVGTANQFKLMKWQYDIGYEGTKAGIESANNMYENQMIMQDRYQSIVQDYIGHAQSNQNWQAGAELLGTIGSMVGSAMTSGGGIFGGGGLLSAANQLQSSDTTPTMATRVAESGTYEQAPELVTKSATASGSIQPQSIELAQPVSTATPVISTAPASYSPATSYSAPIQDFSSGTGVELPTDPGSNEVVTRELLKGSNVVLSSAGLTNTNIPGTQYIGSNYVGAPVYSAPAMLNLTDTRAGAVAPMVQQGILDTIGVLGGDIASKLTTLGKEAASEDNLSELDTAHQDGDFSSFAGTILGVTGKDSLESIKKNKDVDGMTAAYTAYQLFQNWGQMSPGQKSIAVSALGLQNFKDSKGEKVTEKVIPATEGTNYNSMKVKDAYNLLKRGINVAPLVSNWELINDIHSLTGGHSEPEDIGDMAQGMGLLGNGKLGQAVKDVDAKSLSSKGWAASPHHGVGAITGGMGAIMPNDYTEISRGNGKRIAAPKVSVPTVASGDTSGNLLNTAAGHGGVSDTAQKVYSGWEEAHTRKANNGTVGGSATVSSLYGMSRTNPVLFASTIAATMVDPKNRKAGYKSDGKYLAYLGATSLGRLVEGTKQPTNVNKYLREVGTVATNIDPQNFEKTASALRSVYSKNGIKSKADAYGLANQAFAEGRINAADLVGMQKTFNAIFDKGGIAVARKLCIGRDKGVELAKKKGSATGLSKLKKMDVVPKMPKAAVLDKEGMRARNRSRYQIQRPVQTQMPNIEQPQMQGAVA